MKTKILIVRDGPPLALEELAARGILTEVVRNVHDAREQLDLIGSFDTVVVDVQGDVERALEFCDIVHVLHPTMPIIFVRSGQRLSLAPRCANLILEPDARERDLIGAILFVLGPDASSERKPA